MMISLDLLADWKGFGINLLREHEKLYNLIGH